MPAGGASVPRAPGLADLPNVTQADFWLNRASVQEKDGNLKVHCLRSASLSQVQPHICSRCSHMRNGQQPQVVLCLTRTPSKCRLRSRPWRPGWREGLRPHRH